MGSCFALRIGASEGVQAHQSGLLIKKSWAEVGREKEGLETPARGFSLRPSVGLCYPFLNGSNLTEKSEPARKK